MRKRQRSSQPDHPGLEWSREASLDALLEGGPQPDGDPFPGDEPGRWLPVAQVLTALTAAPESRELTGEAQALAQFRGPGRTPAAGARTRRRGRT